MSLRLYAVNTLLHHGVSKQYGDRSDLLLCQEGTENSAHVLLHVLKSSLGFVCSCNKYLVLYHFFDYIKDHHGTGTGK
jgi:hypothetical protein